MSMSNLMHKKETIDNTEQSKMDNPEKLAKQGTQDTRRRQNKNTTQLCVGHNNKQTNTNNVKKNT